MRVAAAALSLVIGLAGCVSTTGEAPSWANDNPADYPSLRDVPRRHDANVDPAHWAAVEHEMLAARQTLLASPRAAPATGAEDPAAFLEEARRELEQTRQSHEP
ncbi:MAG: hypothetical protein AB7Q23_07530 [Hyphomonadaceae bacterium]